MSGWRELWEDYSFSTHIDPLEHLLSLGAGFVLGALMGGAFVWMLFKWIA